MCPQWCRHQNIKTQIDIALVKGARAQKIGLKSTYLKT